MPPFFQGEHLDHSLRNGHSLMSFWTELFPINRLAAHRCWDPPLLQMLELVVAEIQHQDAQVWTMKQDKHDRSLYY